MIECRASVPPIAETDGGVHNNRTVHDMSAAIKVESEVDIKIEDEMEFCAPSTSSPSLPDTDNKEHNYQPIKDEYVIIELEDEMDIKIEGKMKFGETSLSVQSIPTADAERHNNGRLHCGSTEIKDEGEMDIKIEDNMEFFALNSIDQSIASTDHEVHNYQSIKDEYVIMELEDEVDIKNANVMNIKMEGEIEFGEPSISVQSISTTYDERGRNQTIKDEFTEIEIEDEMKFCDEVEKDEFNTSESSILDKSEDRKGNKKKSEFICDICSKKYTRKGSLVTHRKRHGQPTFQCTVCDVTAFRQCDIHIHMMTHDDNRIYFTCNICPKKFSTKAHLAEHRKRHGKPNFRCTVCGVPKFLQYELDRHMKMHDTNPTIFPCDICPKKYTLKSSLNVHRLRHSKPNFQCNVCGVAKFFQYELDKHKKTHDTKKHYTNQKNFTCDLCPMKLSTKSEVTKHRLRHGKPNFKCNVCGVAKFTQREVNYHMKSHDTKRVKITCPQCPQMFLHKQSLKYHLRTVHIEASSPS